MVVTPPFAAVNWSKPSMDLKASSFILPPAFASITASANKYQDDQSLFLLISRDETRVSPNIPPGFKPKKAVGFCRISKQHTRRLLQSSIENTVSSSTYHGHSLIFDQFAKVDPIGSCGVGFGILSIDVALEGMVAARKSALGVLYLLRAIQVATCLCSVAILRLLSGCFNDLSQEVDRTVDERGSQTDGEMFDGM